MRARSLKLHDRGQRNVSKEHDSSLFQEYNIHHPVRDQVYYNTHPVQKCFVQPIFVNKTYVTNLGIPEHSLTYTVGLEAKLKRPPPQNIHGKNFKRLNAEVYVYDVFQDSDIVPCTWEQCDTHMLIRDVTFQPKLEYIWITSVKRLFLDKQL